MSIQTADMETRVWSTLDKLPALPTVAMELINMALSDETSIQKIARVVEMDPAITARVLQVANSPVYGRPNSVSSIRRAIVVLGLNTIRALVLALAMVDTFQARGRGKKTGVGFPNREFWRHSLAVGLTTKYLCDRLGFGMADESFVAGLLHDVGIVALNLQLGEEYAEVFREYLEKRGGSLADLEMEKLGVDHSRVIGLLLRRWKFPETLVSAIENHHNSRRFTEGSRDSQTLCRILSLADHHCCSRGFNLDRRIPNAEFDERIALEVNLTSADMGKIHNQLLQSINKVGQLLDLKLEENQDSLEKIEEANNALFQRNLELEKELKQVSLLLNVSRGLCSTLRLPEALRSVSEHIAPAVPVDALCLVLCDLKPPVMHLNLVRPLSRAAVHQMIRYCVDQAAQISEKPLSPSRVRVVFEGRELIEEKSPVLDSPGYLIRPISRRGLVTGVCAIAAVGESEYTERDRELFGATVDLLGLTIENMMLHDRVARDASHDALTRLPNRRALFDALGREYARAQRHQTPLSLILFDLDGFKGVNDTHGHTVGDQVLVGAADTLSRGLRSYDIAARYGGEEFAVLLPDADVKAASLVGKRLLNSISVMAFRGRNGEEFSITASAGVSAFPENNAEDSGAMVRFSDRALYQAKSQGGNRLVVG